ncbi:MAG: outer membrane beta-barrel protein [Acidobacteria bacterium]|nr:outer membrane beta-barrel protein [Acidobacteriota bacterium]
MIRKTLPFLAAAFIACTFGSATAQSDAPPTPLEKQLHRLDLAIAGIGIYNSSVTGNVVKYLSATNQGQSITQFGSNTAGILVSVQYSAKPYVGFEFNYSEARYTENFTGPGVADIQPLPSTSFLVQAKSDEYTIGYLIKPPHLIYGLQPFASAGAGTQTFKPTAFGGQEEPEQARMTYYGGVGIEKAVNDHFGFRGGYRQIFFLDPDFGQNYLTILKHATTYEPMVGFYLRY